MSPADVGCPRCAEGKQYIDYRWNDGDAQKRGYVDSLREVKKLKMGSLHCCPKCNTSWYLKTWGKGIQDMCYIEERNLPLLEEWNNKKLKIEKPLLEKLQHIKATPLPHAYDYIQIPCAVRLKDGSNRDFCMINIRKMPPIGEYQYLLMDDVADVSESEYALSQKVRLATSLAEEITMCNAPTYVKDRNNHFYNLQYQPDFFEKDRVKGKEILLLEPKDFPSFSTHGSVYSGPQQITYVIADWFNGCESLFIQKPKYMQILNEFGGHQTALSRLTALAKDLGVTTHDIFYLRVGYSTPNEELESKILEYGKRNNFNRK